MTRRYDCKLIEVWRRCGITRPLPVVTRSDPKFCGLAYYGGGLIVAWPGRSMWIDLEASASDSQIGMLRIGGLSSAECGGVMHPIFPMKDSVELRALLLACKSLERRVTLLRMNWWKMRRPEIADFYNPEWCGGPR